MTPKKFLLIFTDVTPKTNGISKSRPVIAVAFEDKGDTTGVIKWSIHLKEFAFFPTKKRHTLWPQHMINQIAEKLDYLNAAE